MPCWRHFSTMPPPGRWSRSGCPPARCTAPSNRASGSPFRPSRPPEPSLPSVAPYSRPIAGLETWPSGQFWVFCPAKGHAAGFGGDGSVASMVGFLNSARLRRERVALARLLALLFLAVPLGACSSFGDWFGAKEDKVLDDPADKLYNEGLFLLNEKRDYRAA